MYARLVALVRRVVPLISKHRAQDFSRHRKLPLTRLSVLLLSLVANGRDKSLDTTLSDCFTLARRSDLWPDAQSPHRSALSKARAQVPWQAFDTLLGQAVTLAYEAFPSRQEYPWHGLSVFAFDGSKDALPATEAVRQAFDPASGFEHPGRGHAPQGLEH